MRSSRKLLRVLPDEKRVWVSEGKTTTSTAGRLAKDYLKARRQSISMNREAGRWRGHLKSR